MKPTFDTRKPYGGLTRSLVIAIDVGTTFSGVSYAILEPGEVPKIHGVTRFPGQEHVAGNSKIPSILYYDKRGDLKAAGAEADANQIQALAEDENWHKVELFKLRLRPRTMTLSMNGLRLASLPARKSPVHIFGDFLSYLYNCTTSFIETTHANGPALLDSVIPNHVEFVLAHPNGWEGAQQAKMRRAAVYGKLVSDTPEGRARIRFVTEGEASLHACVLSGLAADVLSSPSKHGFLIADAGGGTLDISSYAIKGTSPLVIEEIAPPDCVFAGSVFVSRRARDFFEQKLKGSQYGTPDSLDHITRQFDEKTKRLFRDRKEPQFVPFGSPFDKDPAFGIRNGQLRLTGAEVANLFEPSIDAAFNAIRKQIESAVGGSVKSVFLVGGYAASPWLFSQLKERLKALNIVVSRPDTQTSKAVADGAIGFYCDHHVSARMSKFTYGVEYLRQLDPNDPEHVAREAKLCELPSGPKLLPDAFDCILDRGVRVKESKVFSRKYCTELTSLSMLKVFEVEVWCYRGGNGIPKWIERSSDSFSTLCMVRADLSMLSDSAEPKQGKNGKTYWTIVFSVEIHFGLTEFEARIKWVQDGHTKYGPATIVFNERGHRSEEEEPDFYPEDDSISGSNSYSSSSRASDRDHHRSSSTRAKTPPEGHYVDSSRRSSRADSVIPEVARAPSTRPSASIPNTPKSSAHMSLDRSRDLTRDLDRDSPRDRENSRRRSGTPSISDHRSSRSNRSSVVVPPASIPTSPVPRSSPGTPGTPGTPARGLTDPPRNVVASPAKPDPAPLADTDPTPTNATPPGFHATPPPPAPTLSRAASSASAILGTRSPPKTLSVFGEDPKSVFGTPGAVDFLNGAGVGLGIEGLNSTDRPASIFGEDLVPGGTAGGAPASLFGSPAPGMPGGLFDEAPVSSTPITEQPTPGGGWGFGFGAGIAKSIGSIRSGKSSVKASPAISRVPSTSAKVQSALSPLNPAAQEQQQPLALEQQPEAPPVPAPEPAPTPALAPEPAEAPMPVALPKIDTSLPASAIPSGLASALAESGAATPTSDTETPVTAGGTKKKKKKGGKKAEEEEKKKKKEAEDKAKEEAGAAAATTAAKKSQEEEEVKANAQAEEEAKQKTAAELAAAAAAEAEAEAKKVQEEEDRMRLEEEAKKKEEEARASKAKPLAKSLSKKEKKKEEDRERQEKEEEERLEKEEQKKKDDEEKERLRLLEEEEKKKAEGIRLEQERIAEEERKAEAAPLEQARLEEEAKKAEELRIQAERKAAEEKAEAERNAEEERQRADAELLEKERLAEEEKKREEEIRVERERIEKMRLEEEQIQKELAELERQEKEAKEAEERRRQEREAENQRLQEIQERERREKEARERKEREQRETEERERQSKPSLGFGGLWGGKATSFTSSLFGVVSPEPPQQEANESAFGWGGFSGGVKKKTSSTSLAKPTPPPLSRRSSRQFGQGGWGSTLGSSGFEFGSGGNNPTATNSFFGEADIGLNDLKNPAAALEHESEPPPPPAKDDHDTEDAWGFGDAKKDLAKEKPPQLPSPEALHHPYKGAEGVDGESAAEGAWGLSTLSGKDKKKKKGKAAELAGSELPTRTSSPAPPESSADGFATPMGVSEAEPEPVTADEDFGFPLKTKKKKKGKKGADIEGPSGAATPVPGAVGTGGDLGINVQEKLGDLLGGDAEQAATPTAGKEDDDWGLPVKTKKKKAKGGGKKK